MKPSALALIPAILILIYAVGSALPRVYAHTFSSDESASFIALVEQIKLETHLAMNNTSLGTVAQQHVVYASDLLDAGVTREIRERNDRIATELLIALHDLEGLTASSLVDAQAIREKVGQIDDLLGEAVSVRIERDQLNNSTTKALSFALLVNSLSDHYRKALSADATINASEGFSEPLEQTTGSGANRIQVSWSPPEIVANSTNTYFLEFFDARTNQLRNGSTMYAFMFMPASNPEVMIIHRQPEYATDGRDNQTFTFRERHVGSNTMRLTWINGFERELVDFPIEVLPPANNTGVSSENTSGQIANLAEYQTAQALSGRLGVLFTDMKTSTPMNSSELVAKVDDGLQQLKLLVDQKAPADDLEIIIHGQIHPNLQKLYSLQLIPEFSYAMIVGVIAIGGILAARHRMSIRKG